MGRLGDDRLRGRLERADPRCRLRGDPEAAETVLDPRLGRTIRGAVLGSGPVMGEEELQLERDGRTTRFQLDGSWHLNGFAGAMGELVTAIAKRKP